MKLAALVTTKKSVGDGDALQFSTLPPALDLKRKRQSKSATEGERESESWFIGGKKLLPVGNTLMWAQVSLNIRVVDTKKRQKRTAPQKSCIKPKSKVPKNVDKLQARMLEKARFIQKARPISLDDVSQHNSVNALQGKPRTFATGSSGWSCNAKVPITRHGKDEMVQVTYNAVVCGSKLWLP
jgi:hypothetical protein